jgi:hypothetical protein
MPDGFAQLDIFNRPMARATPRGTLHPTLVIPRRLPAKALQMQVFSLLTPPQSRSERHRPGRIETILIFS